MIGMCGNGDIGEIPRAVQCETALERRVDLR